MSNDLGANMRRAAADRRYQERRHASLIQSARDLRAKHEAELQAMLNAQRPATYLMDKMRAAYEEESD